MKRKTKPVPRSEAPPATAPDAQLEAFLAKYTPEIQAKARTVLAKLRAWLPPAIEMVYDNYNALVVGFSPTERVSDAVFSIALYPRWVTLFFLKGAGLPDPHGRLKGNGKIVRHLVLHDPATLDDPEVRELMTIALDRDWTPGAERRLVIKMISVKQRPRRP
jgi:hypothetical protein